MLSRCRAAVTGFNVLLVLACGGTAGSSLRRPSEETDSGGNPGDSPPGLAELGSSGGSGSGGGSASTGGSGPSDFACGADSGPPPLADAASPLGGGCCTSALYVPVGGTVQGSTCGGPRSPSGTDFCVGGHPDAYIYVDAPAGTQLEVSASTGVSIVVFADCTAAAAKQEQCSYGLASNATAGFVVSDVAARLFLVEHEDVDCGDFTFHAAAH